MTGFTIPMMLMQHRTSRDVEKLAGHYDAQVVEACRQRDEAIKRAEVAEAKAKELAGQLAVKDAHAQGLLAQVRAFATQHPDSPLLQPTGRTKENGQPENVANRDFYNPVFDAIIKKLGFGNPLKYRL